MIDYTVDIETKTPSDFTVRLNPKEEYKIPDDMENFKMEIEAVAGENTVCEIN